MLTNTRYFSEAALQFKKHGFYNNAPVGTKEWQDYWTMQKNRSLNGYTVGDTSITGYHYWYLNFSRMMRMPLESLTGEVTKANKKIEDFPAFIDWDYNYFWTVEIARNGISQEDYDNLGLGVNIMDLSGNKHLAVIKARRKGYSYKSASMLARNYHLIRKSKGFALAGEKEFLDPDKDGLLAKTWMQINFIDNNTPFRQPRLTDRKYEKTSGYKRNIAGTDVARGFQSTVSGVTLKDDPNKARGKDGDLIFFEEAGKLPGLLTAWEVCRPSVEDGAFTTGQMIAFGTGGEEGADFEGLNELVYNPEAYNILPVENQWDEGAMGTSACFFVPTYCGYPGFMDKDGNSKVEDAIEYEEGERTKKKKAPNPSALSQYISEHPFTITEATIQTSQNIFPIAEIQQQLNYINVNNLHKMGVAGNLIHGEKGVTFTPSKDVKPINKYPHSSKQDLRGAVVIYEAPYRDENGKVPKNMYVAVHDPYAHDTSSDMSSLGSVHIIKRSNRFSSTFDNSIVATYTGRPSTQDEYNRIMFMLAEYYDCKIAFENDRGNVVEYAKRFKLLDRLEEQFDIIMPKDGENKVKKTGVRRTYGIHMNTGRKEQAEVYVRDWLNEKVSVDADGNPKLRLHTIYDVPLLEELKKFNNKGNFDRVSALFIGMYYLKQIHHKAVKKEIDSPHEDFFLNTQHFH